MERGTKRLCEEPLLVLKAEGNRYKHGVIKERATSGSKRATSAPKRVTSGSNAQERFKTRCDGLKRAICSLIALSGASR